MPERTLSTRSDFGGAVGSGYTSSWYPRWRRMSSAGPMSQVAKTRNLLVTAFLRVPFSKVRCRTGVPAGALALPREPRSPSLGRAAGLPLHDYASDGNNQRVALVANVFSARPNPTCGRRRNTGSFNFNRWSAIEDMSHLYFFS